MGQPIDRAVVIPSSRMGVVVRVAASLLAILVIVWAASKLDWRVVWSELTLASASSMALMAAAWLVALMIRPLRLQILIRALSPEVGRGYWATWSASMIASAINSLVPMRAGDMAMMLVLRQGLGVTTARAFSAVLVDRFFDFATVIVIFIMTLAVAPTVAPWAADLTMILLIGLGVLVGGLLLLVKLRRFWQALLARALSALAPKRSERWNSQAHDLFAGFSVVDRADTLVPILGLSVGIWGVIALSYWAGIDAVWSPVSFAAAAFAVSAVALSFVVPLAPGGLGIFHAAIVLALSLFAVPAEPALAFAIVAHAFQLGSVLVLAAVAVVFRRISIRSLATTRQPSS